MFPLHIDDRAYGRLFVIAQTYNVVFIIMYNVSLYARSISTACHCSLCIWGRLLDLVVYMRLGPRDTVRGVEGRGAGALPLSFACS